MTKTLNVTILNPPSPPYLDVWRDWAGGFGTAAPVRRRADYGQSRKPTLHPFLAYASAVLSNENYDYTILDCQRLKLNKFQVLREVKKQNPDVVFSLIGLPSLKRDIESLDTIKESLPYTSIVGVGASCRFVQYEILLKSKIDAVLRNSYPYVSNLGHFLKALEQKRNLKKVPGVSYVKSGKVINTVEPPDISLNKLLPPHYDALELDGYETFADPDGNRYSYVPILGSKGCPYGCIYCPYPIGFGRKWMNRSPKKIVDEMEYLRAVRKVKGFLFRYQSFTLNKKHAIKICNEIIKRKLDIAWFCEARVDEVNREILEKMKEAGCKRIHYGVETGDSEILKMGKPGANLGTTRKAFRLTKETGLWTQAHIILGWPDDDEESIKKTYRLLQELNPHSLNWNFLTPYPGTKLYKIAKEKNLILTNDWARYTSHTIVMKTKWLNSSQLQKIADKTMSDYSKWRRIRVLRSFNKPRLVFNELSDALKEFSM
ncbi:MAG: radical SAM protein [Candidatus Bathyarchaeota archaeon]|nr:radical SAM protein [Candidatus Bathyarchaeota archaeon]